MSGVDELVAFLRAALDRDEQVAREAIPGPWEAKWWGVRTAYDFDRPGYIHHGERVGIANNSGTVGNREAEMRNAEHIARWDPARVLAEVQAKRRHIARWEEVNALVLAEPDQPSMIRNELLSVRKAYLDVIKDDAQPYAGQPGWREEWAL